jgi:CRP/FNR family transcriptional regulator, cyclic AMP receptor protein
MKSLIHRARTRFPRKVAVALVSLRIHSSSHRKFLSADSEPLERRPSRETLGSGQETQQIRSQDIPVDRRRRQEDCVLSQKTGDLFPGRLVRCCPLYILKGRVRLTVVSTNGKEATIGILTEGDFFGEGCLTGQCFRLSTATALTDCSVLRIDKKSMMEVLHRESAFSDMFVAYLLARNIRYEADLVDQLFNSAEKRLARILLLLAHFGKDGVHETPIPNISQEILAEMIGTTRSRVSRFMNRFRKLGFIDYHAAGDLQVHSSLLNIVLHD